MANILIVEDEPKLSAFLQEGLEEHQYEVRVCADGLMAKEIIEKHDFDVVILDAMLPQVTGFELCKIVKKKRETCPVLMLTALGSTQDKLDGFDAGADDYLVKPFEFAELVARLRVLTRRAAAVVTPTRQLIIADLQLNLDSKEASRSGENITLTAKEFALLEFLMRNNGKVQSRATIAEQVWDINFDTGTNVVDVYINILRKKIDANFEDKLIKTKIGLGYYIAD